MAVEVEDDVFFADLSKQIALLIMDDEEDLPLQCPQLHHQELPQMPQMMMPHLPYRFEVVSHRRESKGTGVFIPRSTAPTRRKNRSRRSTTTTTAAAAAAATTTPADININRQQLHKSAVITSTNSNLICSSHCSTHPCMLNRHMKENAV